ncbi:hypothetical protein SETIT_5G439700v2 [Setaria italica]|uniref:Uncharacterized protein n=1 Tax=Setaria italica TaxID=4555 RepID=A0A368RFQ9_SETIT|nr:hypothetical protein SETIT_5G439700v2 [Setaria italica]
MDSNGQYTAKSAYLAQLQANDGDIQEWWDSTLKPLKGKHRRSVAAVIMYTTWNIWKERNRRIFDSNSMTAVQLVHLIQNDILLRRTACGTPFIREDPIVS